MRLHAQLVLGLHSNYLLFSCIIPADRHNPAVSDHQVHTRPQPLFYTSHLKHCVRSTDPNMSTFVNYLDGLRGTTLGLWNLVWNSSLSQPLIPLGEENIDTLMILIIEVWCVYLKFKLVSQILLGFFLFSLHYCLSFKRSEILL